MKIPSILIASLLFLVAGIVQAAVVTERWSANERGAHPKTIAIAAAGETSTITVTLSGLPAGAKILRATLKAQRGELRGNRKEILEDIEIVPQGSDKPLALLPPWYRSFDATETVRAWAASGKPGVLTVKSFTNWDEATTALDITYEGNLKENPPATANLAAFHRSGQTFLAWKEIEPMAAAETLPWHELREILEKLDTKREVRYRVYRSAKPISGDTLAEATLLAEVPPLSAWNVNARCLEQGIDKKLATADLMLPDVYFPFEPSKQSQDMGEGLNCDIRRFVIDEAKGPLPADAGLYVHTAADAGKFYYAVSACVDGAESGGSLAVLAQPVEESPAEPLPVLQGKLAKAPFWDYPATQLHYVQWCAPPLANLPNMAFSYGVSVPDNPPKDGAMPMEISFHPRRYSYYRPAVRVRRDSLAVCPYDFPNASAWYGYHEAIDTFRSFKQGQVQNYTERRLLSFLTWVRQRWKVDGERIVCVSGIPDTATGDESGASGALYFGLKHREFVSAIMAAAPIIDPSKMALKEGDGVPRQVLLREYVWGKRDWKLPSAEGMPVWEATDCTRLLSQLKPTDDAPFIAIGAESAQIMAFMKMLRSLKRPLWQYSSWGTKPLATVDGTVRHAALLACGVRLNRSLPAITNCSTDADKGSEVGFSFRARWDGETLVDEPARYEVTLTGAGTADVTPRRVQKFKVSPGAKYRWTFQDPADKKAAQQGEAAAGDDGLLTIPKLNISGNPRRLVIEAVQ